MSSDGYADEDQYSAYSSDTEWYWNDDAEPTYADELAAHASHSPVWDEYPYHVVETWEWTSDWDYYSDDYFDGKPSAELGEDKQKQKQTQESPSLEAGPSEKPSRRRRRDPGAHGHDPMHLYGRSIKGTIWKDTNSSGDLNCKPENLNYQPGRNKAIAFLGDWRDVFRESQPSSETNRDQQTYSQSNRQQDAAQLPIGDIPVRSKALGYGHAAASPWHEGSPGSASFMKPDLPLVEVRHSSSSFASASASASSASSSSPSPFSSSSSLLPAVKLDVYHGGGGRGGIDDEEQGDDGLRSSVAVDDGAPQANKKRKASISIESPSSPLDPRLRRTKRITTSRIMTEENSSIHSPTKQQALRSRMK